MNSNLEQVIKQGDNKVFLDLTCLDEDGTPRDLTGVSAVVVNMSIDGNGVTHPTASVHGTATNGVVRVTLLSTDIPTSGPYGPTVVELVLTYSDGTVKASSDHRFYLHKRMA